MTRPVVTDERIDDLAWDIAERIVDHGGWFCLWRGDHRIEYTLPEDGES